MELKLLNENKLKIVLTNEDMTQMDITCEEFDYDDTGTRRIFWEILDKAKHQTGFDAAADKIFVQVYPDKSGGCLMYVTKMNGTKNEPYTYEKKYKSKLYTAAKKKRLIYSFADSEALHSAAFQLEQCGYTGKSDIFSDLSSPRFYLSLEDTKENTLEIMSEYGEFISNPFFAFYLNEHTKKIVTDEAIHIFASIYAGVRIREDTVRRK